MELKLPKSFWFSIIIFVALQWLAIPVLAHFAHTPADIVRGVLFIVGIIYPIYYISTLLYLRMVNKLDGEQIMLAAVFLLIPLFAYLPIVS
ncbi:hypothetical protein [Alteribacter populi]|uniref:hypothetical protein n=1 Tax=Alteribacter populi TaxID=2011011 RepID=UPI000BBACBDA|nr:hypothetical protein [Alteribacter populi]